MVIKKDLVYRFIDKKTGLRVSVNEELAQELKKPVTKKFKRMKLCARFKHNISAVYLPEIWLLSSKNLGVKYLLCVIDVSTKYAQVKPSKDEKVKTVLHGFIEILDESKRNPKKFWGDQGTEFYNNIMQK